MRSPEDVYADLESDRHAREAEISLLEGLFPADECPDRDSLKRSLVLLIYSHVEGFCKFSLLTYVGWLNSSGLKCGQVAYPLAAATMSRIFAALRDPNSKHAFFRNVLPFDAVLHLAAREQAFIEHFEQVATQDVQISDKVVDTKSNVTPELLMKMLFQLGMNHKEVAPYSGSLHKLLAVRNSIAHGDRLQVPKDETIADFRATASDVMSFLQSEVFAAIQGARYLRKQVVA